MKDELKPGIYSVKMLKASTNPSGTRLTTRMVTEDGRKIKMVTRLPRV